MTERAFLFSLRHHEYSGFIKTVENKEWEHAERGYKVECSSHSIIIVYTNLIGRYGYRSGRGREDPAMNNRLFRF